jgi:antitoxin (DNA-binding transcriptional repressor) of toxin-antitoxin stability system
MGGVKDKASASKGLVFTKDNLAEYLRVRWAEQGYAITTNQRVGVPVADLVAHSVQRNAERDQPFVDLWIAILDECLSWFISLGTVVHANRPSGRRYSAFEKSVVLIIGKIIADTTAIRHLVLAGFDTSARTILRSVSEYMEVLVAIVHRPEFANEFVKSETPEDAQAFWEMHLRGGKLRRRVTAWLDLFAGTTDREEE